MKKRETTEHNESQATYIANLQHSFQRTRIAITRKKERKLWIGIKQELGETLS